MRHLFEAVVVSAVALTGCMKGLCTEYVDTSESYVKKYATECHPEVSYSRPNGVVIDQCNTDASTLCTDADRTYIESLSDCLSKLPVCTSTNRESFDRQIQQCTEALEGKQLSDDCRTAGQKVFVR